MATTELSGFVGPLRHEAAAALADAIRAWLDAPGAAVQPERRVSIATPGPTHLRVREAGAVLGLVVRVETGARWQAGPLAFTVEPDVEGRTPAHHALSRRWLARLADWFESASAAERVERGAALAAVHHRWATLSAIDDRDYRHFEHSTSGLSAFLRPSFRCNQDCHFCWEGRDWPDPPDELVFTWLDELARTGARRLTICGGEPTLFRRLPELVARATLTHGMRVHLDTNAIRLRDPTFARALRESGLATALVSFHSADADVSDRMTRARGTWSRTVEGIHTALSEGLVVALNCVVERANVLSLEQHARFVRDHFVTPHPRNPVRVVNYSQPGRYYDATAFLERMVPLDEARPHLTAAARLLHDAGVQLEITGTCGFPSCVVTEVPHVVAWRPNEARDAAHASGRSHEPEGCKTCAARGHCVGLRREYVERFGARGLAPYSVLPDAARQRAPSEDEWLAPLDRFDATGRAEARAAPPDARTRLHVLPDEDHR